MTIDKAIKILQGFIPEGEQPYFSEVWDALQLGIEALKREQQTRKEEKRSYIWRLTGETES